MFFYIYGLSLLIGAYVVFARGMGPLDKNRAVLKNIQFVGGLSSLLFTALGFWVFNWWVPLIGIISSLIFWMGIESYVRRAKSFSLLMGLRKHIGMLLGIIFCIIGLIRG